MMATEQHVGHVSSRELLRIAAGGNAAHWVESHLCECVECREAAEKATRVHHNAELLYDIDAFCDVP
jgi:hypothetical protein